MINNVLQLFAQRRRDAEALRCLEQGLSLRLCASARDLTTLKKLIYTYLLTLRRSARSQARSEAECRHPRLPCVSLSPVDGTSLRFVPHYKRHCVT